MELTFEQVQLPYLQCVLFETMVQEESGETIVPDRMPDMDRIVDAFAGVVLRGKDCQSGSVSLTGDIQAGVLYMAGEEDKPQELSLYLPFTVRRRVEGDAESCAVQCRVRSVEARMLNSRKLSIRVGLCIVLQVWHQAVQTCYRPQGQAGRVQMRYMDYPMRLPVEQAERSLLLQEEVPLPAACPAAARVIFADARCRITEERLAGNQAVCKGNLELRLLYETQEEALAACDLSVPFSQLIPLEQEYEEQGLLFYPQLTSLEAAANGTHIAVEAGILMQCCVQKVCTVPVVSDAYATRGALRMETCVYALPQLLDQRLLRQELRQELPVQGTEILHAQALPDAPHVHWQDGVSQVRVPVQLSALYRDSSGALQRAQGRAELAMEVPSGEAACQIMAWADGPLFAAPGAGCLEFRLPVAAQCTWYAATALSSVCKAALEEEPELVERPAVIIRTLEEEQSMWSLAKELRTTVSAIQIANDLEGDVAPAGTMLLIPIVA